MSEIIDVQDSNVPAILDESIINIARQAESRIEAVNKIKQMAIRVTNHNDWVSQQGKPYLQVSGAEKIARLFGISWQIDEPVMDRDEDGHFSYTYKGKFMLSGATIEAIGTRSSRDGFFNRYDKDTKQKLPPSEVDKGDVKKAAYTNCIGNGITRLLGIRNMTWEELKGGNIDQGKTGKVDYQKEEEPEDWKKHRAFITTMLVEMCGGDEELALKELARVSKGKTKDGVEIAAVDSVEKLKGKRLDYVYGTVKREYEKFQKGGEAA